MTTDNKLTQIFKLIRELNTPPAKTAMQLWRRTGSNKSSFYRDIKMLESLGYVIDKADNRYALKFTIPKSGDGILSLDDLNLIQEVLEEYSGDIRHRSLLKKLKRNLDLVPLADSLPQLHRNHVMQVVRAGINSGHCLRLIRYRSLTGNDTRNREVEPMELTDDERYLIAWDLEKNDQRQFKLERIEDCEIMDQEVDSTRLPSPMDIFGLTGEAWIDVQLELSPLAYHLLLEEFPLSRSFIRKIGKEGRIIFEGRVRDFKGVGRFCLGLMAEVEVLKPVELQSYINEKIENRKGRQIKFP